MYPLVRATQMRADPFDTRPIHFQLRRQVLHRDVYLGLELAYLLFDSLGIDSQALDIVRNLDVREFLIRTELLDILDLALECGLRVEYLRQEGLLQVFSSGCQILNGLLGGFCVLV